MIRTALCIAAVMLAAWLGVGAGAAEQGIVVDVALSTTQLECDGDSARLTLHAVYADGSVASGVGITVRLGGDGVISIPGEGSFEGEAASSTDRNGRFMARLTPAPGSANYVGWWIDVEGDVHFRGDIYQNISASGPQIACPYGSDGDYSVVAHFWEDADADGAMDAGERAMRNADVSLAYDCYHCSIIAHHERTGPSGTAAWDGLWQTLQSSVPDSWEICVDRDEFDVVSVAGVPGEFYGCARLYVLSAGVNEMYIGVQPVADPGPPATIDAGFTGVFCNVPDRHRSARA